MTQATTWGVPRSGPATPATTFGRADDSFDALLSQHKGTTAPSYAVAGTRWWDDSVSGTITVKEYDGADWIVVGTIDTVANTFIPAASAAALRAAAGLGTVATLNTGTSSGNVPVLGEGGALPAVDGSALTGLNATTADQVARDMAASALAYAMASNDATSIVGAVGAFRLSDDFETDNLATKTNAIYDATNDWYKNTTAAGSEISLTAVGGSPPAAWIDGSTASSANGVSNTNYAYDLGSSQFISALRVSAADASDFYTNSGTATVSVETSDDNSTWSTTMTGTGGATTIGETIDVTVNATARYIRFRIANSAGDSTVAIAEVGVFGAEPAQDMTLRPTSTTITANPTDVLAYFAYDPIDSVTLGTDLILKISIDGGSTYATATLAEIGELGSTGEILVRAAADVDAQTGTSLIYSLETANAKSLRFTRFVGAVLIY